MSLGARYLTGLAVVSAAALGTGLILPPAWRPGVLLALGVALLVQGPLGWWLVKAVGTQNFFAAWVLGMLTRVLLLGLAGLAVVPVLGLRPEPVLIGLAGVLLALLLLEGVVLLTEQSRAEAR